MKGQVSLGLLKKQQNLKMSSAAKFKKRFMAMV